MVIKKIFLCGLLMLAGCNRMVHNIDNYKDRLKPAFTDLVDRACTTIDGTHIVPVVATVAAIAKHFIDAARSEDHALHHAADGTHEANRYRNAILSDSTFIAQDECNDMLDRAFVKATNARNEAKAAAARAKDAHKFVHPAVKAGAMFAPAVILVIDAAAARAKAAADYAEAVVKDAHATAARANATAARSKAKHTDHLMVALADHIAAYTEADAKLANDVALRAKNAAKVANHAAFSVLCDGLSNVSIAQLPVDLEFAQTALVHHLAKSLLTPPFHLNQAKKTFPCHD